jgi:diaminopimelate epimerase
MDILLRAMDGTGNQFFVADGRSQSVVFLHQPEVIRSICHNKDGLQCADQFLILEPAETGDVFMRIFNADGSEVSACGNATRAIAWLIAEETGRSQVQIATRSGVLSASVNGDQVTVNMGIPRRLWHEVPLLEACDTLHVPFHYEMLADGVSCSMGNPHITFFVDQADSIDLVRIGSAIECHPFFPEKVNVGVCELTQHGARLRVWERGAGETLACGTGACAAFDAMLRRVLWPSEQSAEIELKGGVLQLRQENDAVIMTGSIRDHGFVSVYK